MDVLTPVQFQCPVTTHYVSGALNYDPMLASSCVPLQTQPCSRVYFEHLHFKARPFFKNFVTTPGPFIEFPHQDFLPLLKKHLQIRIINQGQTTQ